MKAKTKTRRTPSANKCFFNNEHRTKMYGDYSKYPPIPKGYRLVFNLHKTVYQSRDLIWFPKQGEGAWTLGCLIGQIPDGTLLIARKI